MENKDLPAFPVECSYHDNTIIGVPTGGTTGFSMGLTKREYIATKAMQGMLASYPLQIDVQNNDPRYNGQNFAEVIAMNANEFADALLNELAKDSNKPVK